MRRRHTARSTTGPRRIPPHEALRLLGHLPDASTRRHPCANAHEALVAAGHEHEVVRTYGLAPFGPLNVTRQVVHQKTGQWWVPVLELDDGELIVDSKDIVAWARTNRAPKPKPERERR